MSLIYVRCSIACDYVTKLLLFFTLTSHISWQDIHTFGHRICRNDVFEKLMFLGTQYFWCLHCTFWHTPTVRKWFGFLSEYLWHSETYVNRYFLFSRCCAAAADNIPVCLMSLLSASPQQQQIYLYVDIHNEGADYIIRSSHRLLHARLALLPVLSRSTLHIVCLPIFLKIHLPGFLILFYPF